MVNVKAQNRNNRTTRQEAASPITQNRSAFKHKYLPPIIADI